MKKKFILLALTFALVSAGALAMRVKTIVCVVGERACTSEERNQFDSLLGSSLFFTLFDREIPQLITDQTLVFANLKKEVPGTLLLVLQKEDPVYVLQAGDSSYWTVYESGMMVPTAEKPDTEITLIPTDVPIASVSENDTMNLKYHSELSNFSLSLYKSSLELQNSRWIDTNTLELITKTGVTVFLPLENTAQHVRELEIVLNSNEVQTLPEPLRGIDLRFKYPVLRTAE